MINGISPAMTSKCTPSFGMAKLNKQGDKYAEQIGCDRNEFLNPGLYKRAGMFEKPAIYGELRNGSDFTGICEDYGCTSNPDANANFIRHQILTKKAKNLHLDQSGKMDGLKALYESNYDNPSLSTRETLDLLKLLEYAYPRTEYLEKAGLIHEGTDN